MMEHQRWDRVFSATCVGVPWQLRPDQRNLVRLVVPDAEADQGVAQRQVERVSSRTVPEVEIPDPEAGEEVDVGEPTVRVAGLLEDQPVPTVRVGGSSSLGTQSVSRANETNTDDCEVKRVRVADSRGQKRQCEDVQELAAKAEEQHLDADVEVPAHKTLSGMRQMQRPNK